MRHTALAGAPIVGIVPSGGARTVTGVVARTGTVAEFSTTLVGNPGPV